MRLGHLLLAGLLLAGCSTGVDAPGSAASAGPASVSAVPAPTFIKDVCALVDAPAVAAMFGQSHVQGAPAGSLPGPGLRSNSCTFSLPSGATLGVAVAAIPMDPDVPGVEQAMRMMLESSDVDLEHRVAGVGDLAVYYPLEQKIVSLVAVKGHGARFHGVALHGYDPSPGSQPRSVRGF